jgi:hypothetical protein
LDVVCVEVAARLLLPHVKLASMAPEDGVCPMRLGTVYWGKGRYTLIVTVEKIATTLPAEGLCELGTIFMWRLVSFVYTDALN